jgi:nucleotide-binding universal stress UspA family protein
MTTIQIASLGGVSAIEPLFQKVVFGIDFGTASLAAARWASSHVARHANAILSHVVPPYSGAEAAPSAAYREIRPALIGGLSGFARTLDLASVRAVLRMGHPSRCLSAIANSADASLLVLGRRSDANRTRIGEPNVIERLARRSSTSVLVVPEGVTEPPRHVIAAVDGSGFASSVLRVARRVARLHACPLTVLHVVSPLGGTYDRVMPRARRGARAGRTSKESERSAASPAPRALPRWLTELVRGDEELRDDKLEVVVGDTARAIVGAAAEHGGTLVVMGQRGADGAPAGSLGSVTRELLTRSPTAVLAVSAHS